VPFHAGTTQLQCMKKSIYSILFTTLLTLVCAHAGAQKMFAALPETMQFNTTAIEGIFNQQPGSSVDIRFADGFRVTGIIKSNQKVYDNLHTVMIESSNYSKAKLFISRSTNKNNQQKYVGRMIGRGYIDGIEIKSDLAGNTIKKINIKEAIMD
jgi:hypothetical protein